MRILWFLLPDEALILVIVAIALALMLGLIRGRTALSMLGVIVLLTLLSPFIEELIETLPWWLFFLLVLFVALALFRGVLSLLLGQRAAGHATGILAADVLRFGFRAVFFVLTFPFRALGWLLRGAR